MASKKIVKRLETLVTKPAIKLTKAQRQVLERLPCRYHHRYSSIRGLLNLGLARQLTSNPGEEPTWGRTPQGDEWLRKYNGGVEQFVKEKEMQASEFSKTVEPHPEVLIFFEVAKALKELPRASVVKVLALLATLYDLHDVSKLLQGRVQLEYVNEVNRLNTQAAVKSIFGLGFSDKEVKAEFDKASKHLDDELNAGFDADMKQYQQQNSAKLEYKPGDRVARYPQGCFWNEGMVSEETYELLLKQKAELENPKLIKLRTEIEDSDGESSGK